MNTNPSAKRILVYGDSFVYGWLTGFGRIAADKRFTGVMQKQLGEGFELIEEGLRGRMLDGENAFFPYRNGSQQFEGIAGSHLPSDLIIFFLGTNDCNAGSSKSEEDFINAFEKYKKIISFRSTFFNALEPKVLLVCPPFVNSSLLHPLFKEIFLGAEEKSKQLVVTYKKIAENNGWDYFDSSAIVKAGSEDGIHIDPEQHLILGQALAEKVLRTLNA